MIKIKPFIWKESTNPNLYCLSTLTPFGKYYIQIDIVGEFDVIFGHEVSKFETLELAKQFAFDDFKRRLEETIGESVGYDLPIDENC